MIEEDARAWVSARYPTATQALEEFVAALLIETKRQNLISATTIPNMWGRHIVDSAQLIDRAPSNTRTWLDVGTGAGFPGMVIGILTDYQVELVEPRKRRAEFLQRVCETLTLPNVTVRACAVERTQGHVDVISARAVTALDTLLTITTARRSTSTFYLLPKGAGGPQEVEHARLTWHGVFHVEQSITDPQSFIVTARGVSPCTA